MEAVYLGESSPSARDGSRTPRLSFSLSLTACSTLHRTPRAKNVSEHSHRRTTAARKASSSVRPFPSPFRFSPPLFRPAANLTGEIHAVYDITARDTFDSLASWINELDTFAGTGPASRDVVRMIVGNKVDKVRTAPFSTVTIVEQ